MNLDFKNDEEDTFRNRLMEHSQSLQSTSLSEIAKDISEIINCYSFSHNEFFLEYFKVLSSSDDQEFIHMLEMFPMIDFLVDQLNSTQIIQEKEIIMEIIDNLVNHSPIFRTPELLSHLFSYIETPESIEMYSVAFIFNIFYAIYQILSKESIDVFYNTHFFLHSMSFFGRSPQIDSLFLQYSYKCAKEFPLNEELIDFMLTTFHAFFNEETSDMIMLTIYTLYKKDYNILSNENVCHLIVDSLQIPEINTQKYALKLLSHLQNTQIKFFDCSDSIVNRIFSIFDTNIENSDGSTFHEKLFISAIRVVCRVIQISASYANSLFFDENSGYNLIDHIPNIIINKSYQIRNEGINVFSQIMRNIPKKIYPFLQNPELKETFLEIIITTLSIDENENLLTTFAASVYEFLTKIQDDNLKNEALSIFLSPEIYTTIQTFSESESEDVSESFLMLLEHLDTFQEE